MKKTIAIEAQRIFRPKKHGMDFVAINYIAAVAEAFPNQEFLVFTKKDGADNPLPALPNIKLVFLPGAPYPIWEQIVLPWYCKKYQVDLLHCTSNTAPVILPCSLVVTIHDIIYLENNRVKGGSWYQRFGNLYRKWIVPTIAKKAAAVITVSHYEKENIKNQLPNSAPVHVIYNAANAHFKNILNPEKAALVKKEYSLPEQYFVFLGNTDPKKNVNNVLKAFYALWQQLGGQCPKLVVPDYPESWLNKWFLANQVDTDFTPFIHRSNYINNHDLPFILNQAVGFLYPSRRESFGIPILEGFHAKVPVITSNVASMPEVADTAALYVDPFSPESITQAMQTVMDATPEQRQQWVEAGEKRAQYFSWEKSAKQLMDCYNQV